MTIVDLIEEFRILYDLGSLALPGLEDSEIKKFLQIANYRIINQKFGGNNVYGDKFPNTKKRIDDLHGLIVENTSLTFANVSDSNSIIITLPSDFLHMVELYAKRSVGRTYETAMQVNYKQVPRFNEAISSNEGVYLQQPVYIYANTSSGSKKVRMYTDSDRSIVFGVDTVGCLYIKQPTDLEMVADATVLIDFKDDVYHELVQSAVNHAKEVLSPQLYNVSSQQLNKAE